MRTALIHDWLTGMRGGEKVLEVFCDMYPEADLFTLVHIEGSVSKTIENRQIRTSFIQKMPAVESKYRYYLPLFPTAIEQFDLRDYDFVLSSSHCVAKGVLTRPDAIHVSYVHTPMRYVWDMYPLYFGGGSLFKRIVIPPLANYLRTWDAASASRANHLFANSKLVEQRISKYYGRSSTVIHPPVDTSAFRMSQQHDGFFLIVSALTPYKRVDLAVEAFNRLGWPLKVVGSGEEESRLRKLAGPTVEMLGWQPDQNVRDLYMACRAFVFPQEEDFGITTLEAQASGKPVIAFGRGGARESVVGLDGFHPDVPVSEGQPTGIFFNSQTVQALIDALHRFEEVEDTFDPAAIRAHAVSFDTAVFRSRIADEIAAAIRSSR